MQNIISISGTSPVDAEIMALQLLAGPNPFKASDAVYNKHNEKGDPMDFPLVIDGDIKGIPCIVRIAEIDFSAAEKILASFGFTDDDLVPLKKIPDDSKFFHKEE